MQIYMQYICNELKEKDMKRDEIMKAMFDIVRTLPMKQRSELTNLIFDLDLKSYLDGLDKGAEIAKSIYAPKSKVRS